MFSLLKRLCLIFWFPIALQGQTAPGVLEHFSTSRGGAVHQVLAKGQFIFAAEGSSLVVYDTRDTPYLRSFERRFVSPITEMALHKGFLYIAANHEGLSKWDITIPIKPAMVGEYKLQDMDMAFQSLDFRHDSILVAAGTSVVLLRELSGIGPAFERIGRIAEQPLAHGRVACGRWLGDYYAAALAGKEKGIGQGIHTYAIAPEARLNFHHYDSAEPSRMLLLASAKRLIVFGGPSFAMQSHLFGLNLQDPGHPALYFCDTVYAARGEAAVQPGILRGDTLWVPIHGHFSDACTAANDAIAVYSLADPGQPKRLAVIPLTARAYHLALEGTRLHVAHGAQGIVTYDISKLRSGVCDSLRVVGRSRPNGGFCMGADALGDKLLTADGDAGFTMHLIQDRKTIATRCYADLGRIDQVRLLSDGLHAVCWVGHLAGDSLVVVRLDDGKIVGSLPGPYGMQHVVGWHDLFVAGRNDRTGFDILDLRVPTKPRKEQTVLLNFNDFAFDDLGRLIVSTEHNIRIFDLSLGGFTDLVTYAKWGEGFGAVAGEGGLFYVHSAKRGLIRCKLAKDNRGFWSIKEELVWKPPHPAIQMICLDAKGLYLGYADFGIYALDKLRFETKGYYRTGLGFRGRKQEGLRDLFCRAGKIYAVEYYGQVTVLKRTDIAE